MSLKQRARERAKRPKQHTDEQMKHVMAIMLPLAKKGHHGSIKYFATGVREYPEFIIPQVFEAFLDNLQVSKVPSNETLLTSIALKADHTFKDSVVQSAFLAMQGLANSELFGYLMQSKPEIGELLVSRWADVLSWMWYFYIACFERSLIDIQLKKDMFVLLCQVLAGATRHQKNCILAIVEIPGSIRLATLLCMLDAESSLLTRAETCRGTLNLLSFLYDSNGAQVNISPLDEVLGAVGGNAKLFIDTLLSRIEDALPSPVLAEKTVASFLNLFVVLPDYPKHPLSIALRARNPSAFLIKVLHRLLEILSEDSAKCSDSDLARRVRRLIAAILAHISIAVLQQPGRTKLMLEMLQGGIMTILIDCAPWAFSFKPCDRDKMVLLLKLLTSLTTRLPIARQASAELERIEGKYSVQARINASMPIIRKLWAILYNTIIARRTVLAQMQSLNSTPMACDNCFRFDERATFKKCANCGMAHYCSKECQSRAWKEGGHRTQCKSLKENPPKSKGRAMNQDRYFLARVAVNDAQQKREHLEQMALIGLKYVSVIIDYTESPPSCNAQCDVSELFVFGTRTVRMAESAARLALHSSAVGPSAQQAGLLSEGTPNLPPKTEEATQILKELFEGGGTQVVPSEPIEESHIQLGNSDAHSLTSAAAPPVHVIVYVPADGDKPIRLEHFVVDDFWDFVHIKFEDSGGDLADPFQDIDEDVERKSASLDAEIQETPRPSSPARPRKAQRVEEGVKSAEQPQDVILDSLRVLANARATAVRAMSKAVIREATSILRNAPDGDTVVPPEASTVDSLEVTGSGDLK